MKEHELRALIEEVRSGHVSRRSFVQRMVALGLTAPMASTMLMHSGVAQAQTASTKRTGEMGTLTIGMYKIQYGNGIATLGEYKAHYLDGVATLGNYRAHYRNGTVTLGAYKANYGSGSARVGMYEMSYDTEDEGGVAAAILVAIVVVILTKR